MDTRTACSLFRRAIDKRNPYGNSQWRLRWCRGPHGPTGACHKCVQPNARLVNDSPPYLKLKKPPDVINDMVYSPFGAGVATIDHENLVKMYSASPSMLGRGHSLLESGGPVWVIKRLPEVTGTQFFFQSLHSSDHHPHIAVGSVDGTCMTTNTLRSTRRGGIVGLTSSISAWSNHPAAFVHV